MSDARWVRIDRLLQSALGRPPHERESFIRDACPDDDGVRDEALSLLAHAGSADQFLEPPPAREPLPPGARLNTYEIRAQIGAGGMGEVYRAHDSRLRRDIALKILPPEAADAERLQRFEREAQAVAALNHPNIVTIHSVEQSGELHFLTMELVDGRTLGDVLPRDGLPIDRLLEIAIPLADAIAAAHARGVVHRDLKPANVMVTTDGRVKVLDFGLAKLRPDKPSDGDATKTSRDSTVEGRLLGTVAYMSPEQAEGRAIDHRSDLFSLGVVLYELATGRRPFQADSTVSLLAAIVRDTPPPVTEVKPALPRELGRLVRRCLAKDPNRRYQSALDVRNELEEIQRESATELSEELRRLQKGRVAPAVGSAEPARQPQRWIIWASAIAMVLVALGLVAGADRWWTASSEPILSVAVLPLANLMGTDDQEYDVAAMHEALIAELGQISALTVISRTSVIRYQNTNKSAPEIARELKVDALVEGSIFKSGDRVRVQVQLIRTTPAERQLWSRTFDGELQDVMALQKGAARAIAAQMQLTMTPQEAARLATVRRIDPAAYDAWAQGAFQFSRTTVEALHKCVDYAAKALAIDSSYAPAHALTALCQGLLPNLGGGAPHDLYPKAAAAARRALDLDDSLADAHIALGWTLAAYDWDWAGAEREYRRGLELNPSSAIGHSRFGWFLSWLSRNEEALAEVKRGVGLNPASPGEMSRVSAVHFVARRYDDAIRAAGRALEIDSMFAFGYHRLGQPYIEMGQYELGIGALEKAVHLSVNVNHKGVLGRGYALSGRRNEARGVLDALLSPGEHSYTASLQIAQIYAALGEKDEALRWLEQGFRVRDGDMVLLRVFPGWDSLRSDPRFQNLLQRMKFP